MRQSEVEELAALFKSRGEEDRARRLLQNWLADRRKSRLSASDVDGRILLAANYEKMLGDRSTAADLLREALTIDPASKTAAEAFLRMGYRRGESGWYDPESVAARPAINQDQAIKPDRGAASSDFGDTLRGLTRTQVRSRLGGKPDQIIRSASQGRCVEQWIYKNGKGTQVVRFVFEPSTTEPRASAAYSDQK
jgi:tetratricopeptide (TPR) repeat protein